MRGRPVHWGLVVFVLVGFLASGLVPSGSSVHAAAGGLPSGPLASLPGESGLSGGSGSAAPAPSAASSPSAGSGNTPCYSLNATICVSVANASDPNIIPAPGTHVSSVEPLANATINLWVRSEFSLVWAGNFSYSGRYSPLALNATGVLWNGVPFYSTADATVWHPPGNAWWSFGPTHVNRTYPYYYGLTFSPRSSGGGPSFFPGMTLTWWIYFVQNTSGVFTHWSSVPLQFTFQGAWPASPYPGATQYGGSSSAAEDLAVTQAPAAPNYNDTVNVTLATTPLDLVSGATIGGAYVDLTESAPDGAVLNSTSLSFPVTVEGTVGAVGVTLVLPSSLATYPGALITYRVSAWDMSGFSPGQVGPDLIVTQWFNYTVNGNGSFETGLFADDLAVSTVPVGPGLGGNTLSVVPAGNPVRLTVASRATTTAIEAAQVLVSFSYPGINETVSEQIALARVNSTHFMGVIPGLPLGSVVGYRVVAWDFHQDSETSSVYTYDTPTLQQWLPTVPANSSFFVIYVYDAGNAQWVSGASVTVAGVVGSGYVHSSSQSLNGVAYPNQTGKAFVPLLLSAGTSYRIWVNDSAFRPPGSTMAPSVVLTTNLPHIPTQSGIREVGPNYVVAEAGASFYFWLNQTISGLVYATSESPDASLLAGAALGIGVSALAAVPLAFWWMSIQARRAEQERRITL